MPQKLISQGAEARIYEQKTENDVLIVKDRFRKTYRHEALDKQLRTSRARREAKVLEKLSTLNFPVPKLVEVDDKNARLIMEKIPGISVKEFICKNEKDRKKIKGICLKIGEKIAFLHLHDIIHSDLTTSNMIYAGSDKYGDEKYSKTGNGSPTIYLIDFGGSYFSAKSEDKAVDLHLIERAVESKHHKIF